VEPKEFPGDTVYTALGTQAVMPSFRLQEDPVPSLCSASSIDTLAQALSHLLITFRNVKLQHPIQWPKARDDFFLKQECLENLIKVITYHLHLLLTII
jgi:hypothetical protein